MSLLILSRQRTLLPIARQSTAFRFLARTIGSKEYPLFACCWRVFWSFWFV